MTQPARTLLVLAVMAIGGVSVLAWMASQYEKKLSSSRSANVGGARVATAPQPVVRPRLASDLARSTRELPANPELEDFLAVRGELARAILDAEGRTIDATFVLERRRRALDRTSLSEERYIEIRESYRAWRSGNPTGQDSWNAAFSSVRDELIKLDLDRYESLDP